jgi:hypothetical protein
MKRIQRFFVFIFILSFTLSASSQSLADAAHKAGMPICWYFSPADCKDPDCRNPKSNDLFTKRVLEQVSELLTNYGKISLLWIDYEVSPSPVNPKEIYDLALKLQPEIMEIKGFEVQYEKDGKWLTIAKGTKMGEWKQNITPVIARKFRLVILERAGFSGIKEFQLFADNLN